MEEVFDVKVHGWVAAAGNGPPDVDNLWAGQPGMGHSFTIQNINI